MGIKFGMPIAIDIGTMLFFCLAGWLPLGCAMVRIGLCKYHLRAVRVAAADLISHDRYVL